MNQSENISELAAALSKAQGEILPAIKDSKNPFFKSSYADLNSVMCACKLPLSKNNLCVIQTIEEIDGKSVLVTTLAHSSGQWIRSLLPILCAKSDIQSLGSAITYSRRYSLAAIVGVTTDDDDGNSASSRPVQQAISQRQYTDVCEKFSRCDKIFQEKLMQHLGIRQPQNLHEIPLSSYQKVMEWIESHLASQQKPSEMKETAANE